MLLAVFIAAVLMILVGGLYYFRRWNRPSRTSFRIMSEIAIRCEGLGKQYHIGQRESFKTLRDAITDVMGAPLRRLRATMRGGGGLPSHGYRADSFWALKDLSFEIKRGEVVGIIGRNGAGKSTLLKVLSRITAPTNGEVEVRGRVASLLEVGTGFHPELSGRENIFLNGAILGMRKSEITRKFDEIVAFAEVEKFIDTPVKRYSSGMYVRLAFAVAAHLEPEVLIVDEVLAVGDAAFQKKCLGKMGDVARRGLTVLFVSHQMSAIERLCQRCIMLNNGKAVFNGATRPAINHYLKDLETFTKEADIKNFERSGSGDIKLTRFSLENTAGEPMIAASSGGDVVLVFDYESTSDAPPKDLSLGFSIHNSLGETLSIFYSDYAGVTFPSISRKGSIKCLIRDLPFSVGRYLIGARVIAKSVEIDWPKGFIGHMNVEAGDFYGTGCTGHSGMGPVLIRGEWLVETKGA